MTASPHPDPGPAVSETAEADAGLDALAMQARTGEPESMDALLRAVHPRVHRWALTRCGDADDADDVAQQVLVRLWRSLEAFDGRSRFTTWLYRVTMNRAVDHLRSRASRERLGEGGGGLGEEAVRVAGGVVPGADRVEDDRTLALVRVFFHELPDRQRQVFDLVELQGRSAVDVAEMLGLSPPTVRAHLLRARRAIRGKILEGHPALARDRGPG